MGIFYDRKPTVAELRKRLADFDDQTDSLRADLEKAQARVSAALARDDDATKLLNAAATLRVQVDARPLAKEALERELRRAERAESITAAQEKIKAEKAWAGRMAKAGKKIIAAVEGLASGVSEWQEVAQECGGSGPPADRRTVFLSSLKLEGLGKALSNINEFRRKPQEAVDAVRRTVKVIEGQAAAGSESRLASLEAKESADPEIFEAELEAAQA
jgi:hypothetical protein